MRTSRTAKKRDKQKQQKCLGQSPRILLVFPGVGKTGMNGLLRLDLSGNGNWNEKGW